MIEEYIFHWLGGGILAGLVSVGAVMAWRRLPAGAREFLKEGWRIWRRLKK